MYKSILSQNKMLENCSVFEIKNCQNSSMLDDRHHNWFYTKAYLVVSSLQQQQQQQPTALCNSAHAQQYCIERPSRVFCFICTTGRRSNETHDTGDHALWA